MKKSIVNFCGIFLGLLLFSGGDSLVFADPPPWAPAHGYRNKKSDPYDGYRDRFGILEGRCYRETAGGYLGRVLGDAAGSRMESYQGRALASVAGILLGDVFDRKLSRSMDDIDHFCTGQALEFAGDNQVVKWRNPDAYSDFLIRPFNRYERKGRVCRDFTTELERKGKIKKKKRTACRGDDGVWRIE
ncbi:MAG: RT0821/Lpp0805 family surface protein [Gammaproteobacteria bacterium]